MSSSSEPTTELISQWKTLGDGDESQTMALGETIVPETLSETVRRTTPVQTPEIGFVDAKGESALEIGETLGEGGMGVVRLARQTSLWRDVAVKTVLPEQRSEKATGDLLREAWITGMLEHPNIIPVHALGSDEEGAPIMVMKCVEGVSWSEALDDCDRMPKRFRASARDELEAHLQVLMQICNAVHFAHSRGIVHRDLKPENVMLGEFGEVYLVDWGIAVSLVDDGSNRFPLASDIEKIAGTPCYMAPEMAASDGASVDERTDVYLLGAILHQLITGKPRHEGETLMAMMLQAYESPPVEFDESVPSELAAICNRATSAKREKRFFSAEQFRLAIGEFLQHRDSRRLADQARTRLKTLEQTIAGFVDRCPVHPDEPFDEDAPAEIYQLFAECRFGFEQALEVWSNNENARQGLQTALEHMIDFELRLGDDKAASVLIEKLPRARPDLQQRLKALRQRLSRRDEEIEQLEELSRDIDIDLASRERSLMALLMALVFGVAPLVKAWSVGQGWSQLNYPHYNGFLALTFIAAGAIVLSLRRWLFSNRVNRRIVVATFLVLAGCAMVQGVGYLLGLSVAGAIVLENGLLAFAAGLIAATIDKRIAPAALPWLAATFGGALYPEYILNLEGLSNLVALLIIAYVWRAK